MSVEQPNTIDAVALDRENNEVILSISDHLDWDDEAMHLEILRDKLRLYLDTVSTGKIDKLYPQAKGRRRRIRVYLRCSPPESWATFAIEMSGILREQEIDFEYKVLSESA